MYWEETKQSFGIIKEGKSIKFSFKHNINCPEIISIASSCGCTRISYKPNDKTLEVIYKSGFVPKHLIEQEVNKTITVTYRDGTEELLSIVGTKIR